MIEKLAFLGFFGEDPEDYVRNEAKVREIAAQEKWSYPASIGAGAGVGAAIGMIPGSITGAFSHKWLAAIIPSITASAAFGVGIGTLLKGRRDRQIDLARKLIQTGRINERVKDELIARLDTK